MENIEWKESIAELEVKTQMSLVIMDMMESVCVRVCVCMYLMSM